MRSFYAVIFVFCVFVLQAGADEGGKMGSGIFKPHTSKERFDVGLPTPDGFGWVKVAEGGGEPKSAGSYTARLYKVSSGSRRVITDFVEGHCRHRDGGIVSASMTDRNGDGKQELVIVMKSAGSGGYLSADVFEVSPKGLHFVLNLSGIPQNQSIFKAVNKELEKKVWNP